MNRIAAVTVIRGEGECQAFINGVADEEIRRKQDHMRAATERARVVKTSRNRLLARRMAAITRKLNRKPNLFQRIWAPVAESWAMAWAVWFNAGEIFINWCVEKGWLEKVEC